MLNIKLRVDIILTDNFTGTFFCTTNSIFVNFTFLLLLSWIKSSCIDFEINKKLRKNQNVQKTLALTNRSALIIQFCHIWSEKSKVGRMKKCRVKSGWINFWTKNYQNHQFLSWSQKINLYDNFIGRVFSFLFSSTVDRSHFISYKSTQIPCWCLQMYVVAVFFCLVTP